MSVREEIAEYVVDRPADVVGLARAGLLFRRMTVAEFWALMDDGLLGEGHHDHVELLDGEVVIKAMGKGNAHGRYKSELINWFVRHRPESLSVGVEPTIDFSDRDVFEPDLVIYPRGAPTRTLPGPSIALVIEVADSSLPHDTREKARRYAAAGVECYWVVDVTRRLTYVYGAPGPHGYRERRLVEAEEPIMTPWPSGDAFRLSDLDLPSVEPF